MLSAVSIHRERPDRDRYERTPCLPLGWSVARLSHGQGEPDEWTCRAAGEANTRGSSISYTSEILDCPESPLPSPYQEDRGVSQ